jgi:ketosteroid isomerase-like protein
VSVESVELMREMVAAIQRGDYGWFMDRSDPEIVNVQPPEAPDAKTYRGHQGIVEALEDWPSQWDEFEVELVEVIDLDEERLISVTHHRMKAREIEVEQKVTYLYTIRNGLGTRMEMFLSREAALQAAGISEDDAPGS